MLVEWGLALTLESWLIEQLIYPFLTPGPRALNNCLRVESPLRFHKIGVAMP
jgi:hypothetical protein